MDSYWKKVRNVNVAAKSADDARKRRLPGRRGRSCFREPHAVKHGSADARFQADSRRAFASQTQFIARGQEEGSNPARLDPSLRVSPRL